MSAYYDLYETPSPNGSEEKKSLHARICPKETYTQKEFVEHVAMFQHLPKNIIGAALDACIDELCDLLANGNIVELGELGFFSTSLKCTQDTDKSGPNLSVFKTYICVSATHSARKSDKE